MGLTPSCLEWERAGVGNGEKDLVMAPLLNELDNHTIGVRFSGHVDFKDRLGALLSRCSCSSHDADRHVPHVGERRQPGAGYGSDTVDRESLA